MKSGVIICILNQILDLDQFMDFVPAKLTGYFCMSLRPWNHEESLKCARFGICVLDQICKLTGLITFVYMKCNGSFCTSLRL